MKKNLIITLALSLSSLCYAYTFKEENRPISAKNLLRDATKLGLGLSNGEIMASKDIRSWSKKTKDNHLNSGAPDPLLLEQKMGDPQLHEAKVIGRQQLFRAVEKHWNRLKDSALNEPAAESFAKFEPYLKRELDKIEYIDSGDRAGYVFSLPWANVRVDKKLKKVTWVIRIGSHLDGNRLEQGAEKIIVPAVPNNS